MEKFREVLETEYLHRQLVALPSPASPVAPRDHIGVHRQKDGDYYIGVAPVVGRIDGTDAGRRWPTWSSSTAPAAPGSRRTRSWWSSACAGADTEAFVADLASIGLSARPSNWRRSTMACTGIEYCKLAIVDTKRRAQALVTELEKRGSPTSTPRSRSTSTAAPTPAPAPRSPTSASRASWCWTPTAARSRASRCTSAAALGLDANFGRKLRAHKVTSAGLDDYVASVVTAYLADREPGESFAAWVARADEAAPAAATRGACEVTS